jgi:hypothetical protein
MPFSDTKYTSNNVFLYVARVDHSLEQKKVLMTYCGSVPGGLDKLPAVLFLPYVNKLQLKLGDCGSKHNKRYDSTGLLSDK